MAFGYEVLQSPLQTAMLYNAVTNNGKMMKPYLVNSAYGGIRLDGENSLSPVVLLDSVCFPPVRSTHLKDMLEGVVLERHSR